MANPLLAALGFVGNVLDTPGAVVRTALAGRNPLPGVFDPEQRATGRDLLEQWGVLGANEEGLDAGDVGGFLAEVLLDPLNLAGGLALKPLAKAALARGPRYPGGVEKLLDVLKSPQLMAEGQLSWTRARDLLNAARHAPDQARILAEIPPGSSYLGHGEEAVALATPAGDVLRLEPDPSFTSQVYLAARQGSPPPPFSPTPHWPAERAPIPEMLQPTRQAAYQGARVERLPMAPPVHGVMDFEKQLDLFQDVERGVRKQGYRPVDVHGGNVAYRQGRPVIIDPGTVVPETGMLPTLTPQAPPGPAAGLLLDALGYNRWVRNRAVGGAPPSPLALALGSYNVGARAPDLLGGV